MAELLDDNEQKKKDLYRKMLAEEATAESTKKYSFPKFKERLSGDEVLLDKVSDIAVKKGWSSTKDDFYGTYFPELFTPQAPPAPKPQAAPAQQFPVGVAAPGAIKGAVPSITDIGREMAFEPAVQEPIEPVGVMAPPAVQKPIPSVTEVAREMAFKPPVQPQMPKEKKERGFGEWAGDVAGTIAAGGKRIGEGILSSLEYYVNGTLRAGLPEIEATQSVQDIARNEMFKNAAQSQKQFQDEAAKRNIQTSVLQAIDKEQYKDIPEAVLYTVGDAAMQIIPSILTMGGSTYLQTLPQSYKDGVEAIAKEKGISPEQVIANGDDAMIIATISSGVQSALEFLGAGLVSKSMASRGAYKAMRDWLLRQGVNRNLARGLGLLGVGVGEGLTEYSQEGTGQIGVIAAKSPTTKAFFEKLPKELFTPQAKRQREEAFVGGLIGGAGVGGGGQVFQSAMDRTLFEAPKIGKATQRPDASVVMTDDKLIQRNNLNKAMESAIQANPEAEGQIRERYRKLNDALELTDDEVVSAYDGIAQLPDSKEKDAIRERLEQYMAEKGIQPEATGMEAGLGEGLRTTAPVIQSVNPDFPPPQAPTEVTPEPAVTETAPVAEEIPFEEVTPVTEEATVAPLTEEELAQIEETELTPEEEAALLAQEETAPVSPAEEEVVLEEEVTPEAVPLEPVAQKETQVGGIVRGYENISGSGVIGDIRNELPDDNSGTLVLTGADGNQYAVSYSRRGGDGENIFEQGASTPRGGHIYTAVQIQDTNNAQEVEQAKRQAETSLASILPTVKKGKINKGAVEGALQTSQAAPAPQVEEVVSAAPVEEVAPEAPAALPKELLGDVVISSTGFGGDREHTTGKVKLQELKVLDVGIKTARQTLKTDKSFKPSKEPIVVGVDVNTGEKQLLDGYHRYLIKNGKGEVAAKFIPMRNGEIISFEEAKAPAALAPKGKKKKAPVTPAPAAPKPIEFGKQLEQKYGVRVDLLGRLDKGDLTLSRIEVPKDQRKKGVGTKVMEEIIKYADENSKRLVLSPTKEFGATSVDRLRNFYKGFGFVENKGANKDLTIKELMYRLPTAEVKEVEVEAQPAPKTKEGKKAEAKEETVTPASKPQEAAVEIAKAFTDRFGIKVSLIDSKGLQDLLSKSENAKEFFFKVLDKIDVFETDNIQEAKNFITTVFQTVESAEDAKKAYRKLAIKYHPDKRGSEEVMKHLNDVNEKYQKGTLGRGTAQQERPSQATKEQRYREWAEKMSRQYEADARAYAESSQMGDEQRAREAAKAQAEKEAREARAKAAQPTQKETKAEQPKPAQPTSKIKKGIIESLVEFFTKPFGAEKTTKGEVLTFETRSKYKQDAWNKRNSLKEENRKNELNRINENLKNYTSDRITTKQYRDNEAAIRSEYANKNKAVDDWYNNTVAAIDKAYEKKIPFAYKQYVGDKVAGLYDPVSLQAYVVLDNLDETTFVHEAFSHPFIEAVKERNNELYNNLLAESKNTQEIVDYVDENYGNAPQQVKDAEYIARAIDLDAKGKLKNKTLIEYVRQFWAEANKIFKDIFGGKGAAIENISPTTKVSDIVDFVLTSGERLDLTKPSTPSFTSQQSSEAATAFDKAKTSKGFDKKYGKGAYKALSDITKNFDAIMDKVSDKIKQDCL